jgi:Na+-transporting NADH:ubiquinone oxidoreductase subunit NqrD
MSLDDILSNILKFTYEVGRTVIQGERDRPALTLGDHIKLGFTGILLIIAIIISFTGIGTIPGIMMARGIILSVNKDNKFIGLGPLFTSTFFTIIGIILFLIFISNIGLW